MLNHIRALVPIYVKGEILEDSYKVSPKEFYKALQLSYCNVSLVVAFGRFIALSNYQQH